MSESVAVVLNLWKKDLGSVPDSVWERTELEALILADNGLTEISARVGGLSRLRMLDLGHNELTRLPESLGNRLHTFPSSHRDPFQHRLRSATLIRPTKSPAKTKYR